MSESEWGATSSRSRSRSKGAICFEVEHHNERKRVRLAQDIDPSSTESITTSEPDARSYSDELPTLPPPGTGESEETCGQELPLLFCPNCASPETVERSCRRSRCPHSWQSWDFHRARRVAAKTAAQDAYRSSFETSYKHHVTVSMANLDIKWNSSEPLDRAIQAVKRLMNEVNVQSGYIFYHPYRIDEDYRGDVLGHDSGDGEMTWPDILSMIEGDDWPWGAIKSQFLSYEPHFHVICTSNFVQGGAVTRQIEDQTGVVVERITKPHPDPDKSGTVSIFGEEDLCRVSMYALSHTGLEHRDGEWRAAYRPFGEVANMEPTTAIESTIDETMREQAWDVLGVEFETKSCDNSVLDRDSVDFGFYDGDDGSVTAPWQNSSSSLTTTHDSTKLPRKSPESRPGDGSRSPSIRTSDNESDDASESESSEVDDVRAPDWVSEPPEDAYERCDGALRPIHQASGFLDHESHDDWREEMAPDDLVELRSALDTIRRHPDQLVEPSKVPEPPPAIDDS